jgi:hypothetical protein
MSFQREHRLAQVRPGALFILSPNFTEDQGTTSAAPSPEIPTRSLAFRIFSIRVSGLAGLHRDQIQWEQRASGLREKVVPTASDGRVLSARLPRAASPWSVLVRPPFRLDTFQP